MRNSAGTILPRRSWTLPLQRSITCGVSSIEVAAGVQDPCHVFDPVVVPVRLAVASRELDEDPMAGHDSRKKTRTCLRCAPPRSAFVGGQAAVGFAGLELRSRNSAVKSSRITPAPIAG